MGKDIRLHADQFFDHRSALRRAGEWRDVISALRQILPEDVLVELRAGVAGREVLRRHQASGDAGSLVLWELRKPPDETEDLVLAQSRKYRHRILEKRGIEARQVAVE
jgi:hypothetical protein